MMTEEERTLVDILDKWEYLHKKSYEKYQQREVKILALRQQLKAKICQRLLSYNVGRYFLTRTEKRILGISDNDDLDTLKLRSMLGLVEKKEGLIETVKT